MRSPCGEKCGVPVNVQARVIAVRRLSPLKPANNWESRSRFSRGGRQLNWALHVVALQRVRHHAETRAYYQRLLAAGKTTREARRCVKRALARHFYRRLCELPTLP